MLNQIIASLKARTDLTGWSIRHLESHGVQLYAVPDAVEAVRNTSAERYIVEVFRNTTGPDGAVTSGSGNTTLLPGDDIGAGLDRASMVAGMVHNQPHSIPGPGEYPDVELADPELQSDAVGSLQKLLGRLRTAVAANPQIRLTAAECFAEEVTTHLVNSRGIDATQIATHTSVEYVLISKQGDLEIERFVEASRRRLADHDIEGEIARQAQYAADRLNATTPPSYSGPVILRGATLSEFLNAGVLHMRSSGAAKYRKQTEWEIGQPVFKTEAEGDPLTIWATRQLPYGNNSDRFDREGLPAQRVNLIRDNKLITFTADQRYADYLSIPATGEFGDLEMPAGKIPAETLTAEPYVEVINFSWFNPNPVTGEFACEIRLGYVVDGNGRIPFKGGMLVGNVMEALANARWSSETGFYGDYQGPTTARFGKLTIAGN